MGPNAQRDIAGMFDGLTLGPQAASPRIDSTAPNGVNGTHGRVVVPEVQIGFFLHTPFPSSEVFRSVLLVHPLYLDQRLTMFAAFCLCAGRFSSGSSTAT